MFKTQKVRFFLSGMGFLKNLKKSKKNKKKDKISPKKVKQNETKLHKITQTDFYNIFFA